MKSDRDGDTGNDRQESREEALHDSLDVGGPSRDQTRHGFLLGASSLTPRTERTNGLA